MIKLNVTSVMVLDQDEALDFYVDKLGLEKGKDIKQGPFRWLTVRAPGNPDVEAQIRDFVAAGEPGGHVAPYDPPGLADALVDLLDHPARATAMGEAGLELARAEFSVERMAERTLGVYDEALS